MIRGLLAFENEWATISSAIRLPIFMVSALYVIHNEGKKKQ